MIGASVGGANSRGVFGSRMTMASAPGEKPGTLPLTVPGARAAGVAAGGVGGADEVAAGSDREHAADSSIRSDTVCIRTGSAYTGNVYVTAPPVRHRRRLPGGRGAVARRAQHAPRRRRVSGGA